MRDLSWLPGLPFGSLIEPIRVSGYRLPDPARNLPSRIVGMSVALIAAKYYQNILAGLTPLSTLGQPDRRRRRTALLVDYCMRAPFLCSALLSFGVNLLAPQLWPLGTAVGYTIVLAATLVISTYVSHVIDDARAVGLSTVPVEGRGIVGLDMYRQWIPSMSCYLVAVWVIGYLILTGVLADIAIYVVGVVIVNLVYFYSIKCGTNARAIRTGLARGMLTAERLALPRRPVQPELGVASQPEVESPV
jgi:hypothetical protein